jgi:predicted AlkP superfamily phosphohydrolase/phosphomutase
VSDRPSAPDTTSRDARRLLLVGWDSADWKIIHPLLDAGELPGLARLVETGTSGNLTTLEPQLSPMLWTSIATGKMAYHHGVPGFTEVDPDTGGSCPSRLRHGSVARSGRCWASGACGAMS